MSLRCPRQQPLPFSQLAALSFLCSVHLWPLLPSDSGSREMSLSVGRQEVEERRQSCFLQLGKSVVSVASVFLPREGGLQIQPCLSLYSFCEDELNGVKILHIFLVIGNCIEQLDGLLSNCFCLQSVALQTRIKSYANVSLS